MATIPTRIKPSVEARQLFASMVARSDDCHLTLPATLGLAIDVRRQGQRDDVLVTELREEHWIKEAPDGGWLL